MSGEKSWLEEERRRKKSHLFMGEARAGGHVRSEVPVNERSQWKDRRSMASFCDRK